jgi:hypothetical protein
MHMEIESYVDLFLPASIIHWQQLHVVVAM